ncbi:hypothetical protein Fmac_024724 [Flemingia macrophylla]|uniref:Uncharacterized protein n=1 Tax=Flemingia macrophylla TaxID=520843 RepID=A0ABD1LQ63_9FABA
MDGHLPLLFIATATQREDVEVTNADATLVNSNDDVKSAKVLGPNPEKMSQMLLLLMTYFKTLLKI